MEKLEMVLSLRYCFSIINENYFGSVTIVS